LENSASGLENYGKREIIISERSSNIFIKFVKKIVIANII